MSNVAPREPTLGQALVPVVFLVGLVAASVYLYGDDSSGGPNQIALILAAAVGRFDGETDLPQYIAIVLPGRMFRAEYARRRPATPAEARLSMTVAEG